MMIFSGTAKQMLVDVIEVYVSFLISGGSESVLGFLSIISRKSVIKEGIVTTEAHWRKSHSNLKPYISIIWLYMALG